MSSLSYLPMKLKTIVGICSIATVSHAIGANLLLNNANFENGGIGYTFNAGTYTGTPGWVTTIVDDATQSFAGTATDQNGIGAQRFAYSAGNSALWATAAADRAIVTASTDYSFSYSARRDNATLTAIALVDWFDSGGGLISSSTDFGSEITATSGTNGDPFVNFSHTVAAPTGAVAAGVRWGTTEGGMIADNFSLDVVPEPSAGILFGLGASLVAFRRRRA